jgi:hypothetical protein
MGLELISCMSFSFFPLLAFYFPLRCTFLFTLLFSSSHCCFPLRTNALIFALLFSFSCCLAFLFTLPLFYFKYKVFCATILLFVLLCFPFHVVVVGVFLFVEESYTNPLHSFLQELGVVGIWKLKICIFFNKYFSLCLFPFFNVFYLMSFVPLFFCFIFLAFSLWCMACYKLFWRQT